MSHYFVTGHKGFVGSHLVKKLQELGHDIETDMRYLHTWKYDAIIHLAAKTNISCDFDPDLIESNINLTREIFKVNTRIIFGSSCSAEHLTNPYAYTKRYGEHLCSIHGDAVALRFHNLYGTGSSRGIVWWLMQQENGAKIKVRGPEIIRDYIYIDDAVRAILKFIEHYTVNGVVDVGTGQPTETMSLINVFQKLSGKTFDISVEKAGDNEPKEMVAEYAVPNFITLEEGLSKLIDA